MTPNVGILDAAGIDGLTPPATDVERRARCWVGALTRVGPHHFADNARVGAKGIVVDGKVLPLLLADGARDGAEVCSPSSHYVTYTVEEFIKRHPRLPRRLLHVLMRLVRACLDVGALDHVVFVNNWLFATNPGCELTSAEIAAVTAHLAEAWPHAAIVFRSINTRLDADSIRRLRENRYRLVRSRRVYLVDARTTPYHQRDNVRRDRRLLERTPYHIVADPAQLLPHAERLARLYGDLYLRKHSRLNPQFNARFFALTLKEGILTYRALKRDGRLDGFIAFYEGASVMTGAILGYDQTLPVGTGLYRTLIALLMAEAERRGVMLNLSAGADHFKVLRGGIPVEEYDAVYDLHLPACRRLTWRSLGAATNLGARVRRAPSVADSHDTR
jgi:Acetyltransferase (GNAT) domain